MTLGGCHCDAPVVMGRQSQSYPTDDYHGNGNHRFFVPSSYITPFYGSNSHNHIHLSLCR